MTVTGTHDPLSSIPIELLLEVTSHIPFCHQQLTSLLLVNKHMHNVLRSNEHTLTRQIAATQFPLAGTRYPALKPQLAKDFSFSWLTEVERREVTGAGLLGWVERVGEAVESNWSGGRRDQEKRWMRLFEIGLLILWALKDCEDYNTRVLYIDSLSPFALATAQFTLYLAEDLVSEHGAGIVRRSCYIPGSSGSSSGANHRMINNRLERLDILYCFKELLLTHGPSFLRDILKHDPAACGAIGIEYANMDSRQRASEPTTFIAHLGRNSLAAWECFRWHVGTRMWEILFDQKYSDLSDAVVAELVKGTEEGLFEDNIVGGFGSWGVRSHVAVYGEVGREVEGDKNTGLSVEGDGEGSLKRANQCVHEAKSAVR